MKVLKFIILDRFKAYSGVNVGLMCGLVGAQDDIHWFDIVLIKSRHAKFLSVELDVTDWHPPIDSQRGAFLHRRSLA